MEEFKFYINGVEVNEPRNWSDVAFEVVRDKIYFGLERKPSIKSVELWGDAATIVKDLFNDFGVNAQATFWVDRLNYDCLKYEQYSVNVIDFESYKEAYTIKDKDMVFVNLLDTAIYSKIANRENNKIVVGNATTIEDESTSILSRDSLDVLYKSRGLVYEANLRQQNPDTTTTISSDLNNNDFLHPLSLSYEKGSNNAIQFINGATYGVINPSDLNGSGAGYNSLLLDNININESYQDELFTCNFDFNMFLTSTAGDVLDIRLYSVEYDGINFSNLSLVESVTRVMPNLNPFVDEPFELTENFTFNKESDKLYFFAFKGDTSNNSLQFSYSFNGGVLDSWKMDIYLNYEAVGKDSEHKSHFIYNTLLSCLEQITDTPNILYSEILGKPSDGYLDYGEFSKIVVTNGLFLRNAINSDSTEVQLIVNFKDLYTTLTNLLGLSMWFDKNDGLIHIEKRSDAFNGDEVEITLDNIEKELANEFLFTDVNVGNKNVPYENVNGSNEFNNIHNYNTKLNVKSSALQLVTKYNTDYLGVDLARAVQFDTDANVDTKYDDKVFLVEVEEVAGNWQSRMGDSYNLVADVPLPLSAGNLLLTPKRSLIRNSDLIKPSFYKLENSDLNFVDCSNLAALSSQELITDDLIIERSNLNESDMNQLFKPIFWSGEIPQRDIYKLFLNQNTIFTFDNGCETIKGFVWSAKIKNNIAEVKILEKW